MIRHAIRLGLVAAAVVAVVASAGKPKQQAVNPSTTIAEPYDDTWAALEAVFAEKGWKVTVTNKGSGLVATDWADLGEASGRYADCGAGPIAASKPAAQVRFNVLIKKVDKEDKATVLTVTPEFRRRVTGDTFAACKSLGVIETTVQNEVAAKASTHAHVSTAVSAPPQPEGFFCASSPTNKTVSVCARAQSDCDSARVAVAAVAPDIGPCAAAEKVWCLGARCSATLDACTLQRQASGDAGSATECAEVK